MRTEGHSYDGLFGIKKQTSPEEEIITEETNSESDTELSSAIARVRSSVSEILRNPRGTDLLREALQRVGREREDGSRTRPSGEGSSNNNAGDTMQTNQPSESKSLKPDIDGTPRSLSVLPSEDLRKETSESWSLIDSSAALLHDSMKKLLNDVVNPERVFPLDPFRVNVAVKCASEIAKLMKVKLEAVRLRRELE